MYLLDIVSNIDSLFHVCFGTPPDTMSNEGVVISDNSPLHNQPPVDSRCSNCRVVNFY